MEEALELTTASGSRNCDWLSSGRTGVKHQGLELIRKEKDGRRYRLRLTAKGKALAQKMKSCIYG